MYIFDKDKHKKDICLMAKNKKVRLTDLIKKKDFPFIIQYGILNEDYENHSHDFNEIFIVTKGTAVHHINKNIYSISAGDVFIIRRPDIQHSFINPVQLELFNIMYTDSFMHKSEDDLNQMEGYQSLFVLDPFFSEKSGYRNLVSLSYGNLPEIIAIAQNMLTEYEEKKPGYKTMVKSGFMELMVKLSREYAKGNIKGQTKRTRNLGTAVAYMEKNYREPISIKVLADMSSLSERQFLRTFRECFNMPPVKYINQLRIKYAIELIKNTNMSIKEIARDCGFSDANYFSRKFTGVMGINPSDYKEE